MRPTRGATWTILLCLTGIVLCAYLFALHLALMRGELLLGPACSGEGAFNCHAVTASSWGAILGMPLALWGMLAYVAMFAFARLARQPGEWATHAFTLIFSMAALLVAGDLFLLGVMVFEIRSYCLYCIGTYVVNVLLLLTSAAALGYPWPQAFRRLPGAIGSLIPSSQRLAAWGFWDSFSLAAAAIVALHLATVYVSRGTLGSMRKQIAEFTSKQARVTPDITGDPILGQPTAPIQMIEFSDFLCPACQRASSMNRIILASHRHDTAFIFKNYPLDTSCNTIPRTVHPGACLVAEAAECAQQQGKFWPLHDLIFKAGPKYDVKQLPADAQRAGLDVPAFQACLTSGQGMEAVKHDIAEAQKIGVSSTPTYVINGLPVPGGITPAVFEDLAAVLKEQRR